MLIPSLASCTKTPTVSEEPQLSDATEVTTAAEKESSNTTTTDESAPAVDESLTDETENCSDSEDTEAKTDSTVTESEAAESEVTTAEIDETEVVYPVPDVDDGEIIANANNLWGNVNAYYESGKRTDFTIENGTTALTVHAAPDGNAMVGSIKNSKGVSYIESTMDVFVKMTGDKTFYASASQNPITFDLYRFGMYYYELRAQKQNFVNQYNVYREKNLDVESNRPRAYYEMSEPKLVDGAITTTMLDKHDPKIYYRLPFSGDEYNYIAVDVKVDSPDMSYMRSLTVFAFDDSGAVLAEVSQSVANDGEFHTYYFKLDSSASFSGTVREFRFDFSGIIGDVLMYKNVRAVKADTNGSPDIRLCRYIHMFSDKAQQVIQISAQKTTEGIEEIGIITNAAKDRVNAIIVKDENGTHSSIDNVDWDSVEYVGFDIEDAGIFGYILLPDGDLALFGTTLANDTSSGKIKITLEGDNYVIVQSRAPKDNRLVAPTGTDNPEVDNYVENFDNCADFYMGHRIYTDESHDFSAFITAAETERNPLGADSITVDTASSTEAEFLGYDALRGMYVFKVAGSNFNRPYYEEPNKHFNVKFTVNGDSYERNMYIMTTTTHGELQCAAILNANDLLLPIPVEVGKNFSDGGQNYFDAKDEPWSEAYFPMLLQADEEKTFNFLNLYMNWGRFPLKQISFIQLAPLYHLSTGVTETNCILPWYSNMGSTRNIWTIPDHRPMSAPFWATQPNHTSGGDHRFLRYTDSEGVFSATEIKTNYISSYGPTYAELNMEYLSDDGKIKVKYTHMEMPQTDENRAYYTMEYEVLEDISFNDFREDFAFYSMNAYNGVEYERIGYLNENNECTVAIADIKMNRSRFYTLGDNCPYFSFYMDTDCTLERGYVNLSFLIKDYSFNLQSVSETPNFAIKNRDKHIYLTLDIEGEMTLKKGDTIKICAIIMPWGSQELNDKYDSVINEETGERYEDKNVRDVRENTLLDPLRIEPEQGCTVIESDFLPKVHVTNGKKATFTVKGASGNSTIKIEGVDCLTVPVVYEKVGTLWQRYNLSSKYYPDKSGYGQSYDGYAVQYNPDGTYFYSFVIDMSKGEDREFQVMFSTNPEPETQPEYNPNDAVYGEAGIVEGPNLMMNADTLFANANKTSASKAMDKNKSKVMTDPDGTKYFRFVAADGNNEAWIMPYTIPSTPIKTGRYLTIKYRLPSTNYTSTTEQDGSKTTRFEIWTSTKSAVPSGNCINYYKEYLSADDKWYVLVIDLAQMKNITFEAAPNGDYYANFLRFDMFAEGYGDGSYIDIAYISFDDRAEDIFAYPENKGLDKVTYYDGRILDVFTTEAEFPAPKEVYEEDTTVYDTPFSLYISAGALAHLGSNTNEFGSVTLYREEGYVRFNSHAVSKESDFTIYRSSDGKETGRYLIIKYRASATLDTYLQFYATTEAGKSTFTNDNGACSLSNTNFVRDGQWQIAILDLSTLTKEYTETDGRFAATLIRLDLFNDVMGTTAEYVDIAFIALCDDLTTAITYDKSVETALVRLDKSTTKKYSTETGEVFNGATTPTVQKPSFYLEPSVLADKAGAGDNMGGATLSADGKYTTVKNKVGSGDGFFFVAADNTKVGRYLMIRYRTESADRWEWGIKSKGVGSYGWFYVDPIADGEWHTIIIDLSKTPDGTFTASEGNGAYYAAALRWDIMNVKSDSEKTVDLAYITASDDLAALVAYNGSEPYALYSYFDNAKLALFQRPVVLHINSFGSNAGLGAQRFYEPLVFDKEHEKYPEQGFINTSPSKAGHIYIGGWMGTAAEAEGFVFRVLDENGNVLADWAELSPEGAYPTFSQSTDSAVLTAVKAKIPAATAAYNFRGYADLNAFAGQTVNIEFALVLKDVPEAERHFVVISAEGVQVTS